MRSSSHVASHRAGHTAEQWRESFKGGDVLRDHFAEWNVSISLWPKRKGQEGDAKPFSWMATAPGAIAGREPARVLVVELALLVGHALALLRVARVARQYPRDRGRGELHHAHVVGCNQAIDQRTQSDHTDPLS